MHNLYRVLACLAGLAVFVVVSYPTVALAVIDKAVGGNQPCPWNKLMTYPGDRHQFAVLKESLKGKVKRVRSDAAAGLDLYETPTRSFWLKSGGEHMAGAELLAYVIAEQEWLTRIAPDRMVRPGDVVMDVGAHVGTFGDDALRRGASKVIMVEIDPVNVECIRRNFAREIADGRVVLVPEGAWNKEGTLSFATGVSNSGTGSVVLQEQNAAKIDVPVRTIDSMVERLRLQKLDFLKMDIEGAEREALAGARGTLGRFRPRLFLDAYHREDDAVVLPRVILAGNPAYQAYCSVCSESRESPGARIVPYAIFYE